MAEIWLVRHAETEWSTTGRHTGRTDVDLTAAGREAARSLAPVLARHDFALALVSPRVRARETARLAGFPDAEVDDDLAEWDYGELEGITTAEIRARGGAWSTWTVWNGPVPGGETIEQVAARAARVVARADAAGGDVVCFSHGHIGRVFAVVALGFEPIAAARFVLDPATINVIGFEREQRALLRWNDHLPQALARDRHG
jgi:broad specificity phosphatase PhoE